VRTYERGVEAETLACGTGSIASAVITHLRKDIGEPPVRVDVEGGHLRIGFRADGERVVDVTLTGDAEVVYRGTLD